MNGDMCDCIQVKIYIPVPQGPTYLEQYSFELERISYPSHDFKWPIHLDLYGEGYFSESSNPSPGNRYPGHVGLLLMGLHIQHSRRRGSTQIELS